MVKGLILTTRDVTFLYDCYHQVVLSLGQIARRHFPQAKAPTVCNRLTQLRREGVLSKTRVGLVLYKRNDAKEIGTVYQVTRKGIQILQARFPEERFRSEAPRIHPTTLAHDLLLTDAMAALQRRYSESKMVHGKLVIDASQPGARCPDAVIQDPFGKTQVAIELELTAKSERRYRDIILQYRLANEYPAVLYVVGSSSIAEKIKTQILGLRPQPGIPALPTGKFYFVTLDALLTTPTMANITNGDTALYVKTNPNPITKERFA